MERFTGIIGIILILGVAWGLSNDRKNINYRTVGMGLLLQCLLAVFILKTPVGKAIFGWLGRAVTKVLSFSDVGAKFVFGILGDSEKLGPIFGNNSFIFFFRIVPTIIFVACLVNILRRSGDGLLALEISFSPLTSRIISPYLRPASSALDPGLITLEAGITDSRLPINSP